jgi:CDP-diacylglycerol--glycerol-3-phosphate 3-phosphatidyltransferase
VTSWADYAQRWSALHGGYDPRTAPPLVRGWLRFAYTTGGALVAVGAGPDQVTVVGLALSAIVPLVVALGGGWPLAAALVVLASVVADSTDGAVAVISGRASRLGHVYDSVADRVSEAFWLLSLVVLGAPAWLVVPCGALAWLHEYVRARAATAGMRELGAVTVAERPTRALVTILALAVAGLVGLVAGAWAGALVAVLATVVWSALGVVGFVQLARAVRRALT